MISKKSELLPIYHGLEISLCGYSGSGKTTLIEKLIQYFAREYSVGFVKSDAHHFDMDRDGKDTARMWAAGATAVHVFDPTHWAYLRQGETEPMFRSRMFDDVDFVLVEGQKASLLPKLVMVDPNFEIIEKVKNREIDNIHGLVGPWDSRPPELSGELDKTPYFHRDNVSAISQEILKFFRARTAMRPLVGLVLSGGISSRMGQDKALLEIGGASQLQRTFELTRQVCDQTYYSHRLGQVGREHCAKDLVISDRFLGFGPVGGILSAFTSYPNSALLVVACDLPFLNLQTLTDLVRSRDPLKMATAYRAAQNGLPEPLCAIYEPHIVGRIFDYLRLGKCCPRKILMNVPTRLIDLTESSALENMNYPDEYRGVLERQGEQERRGL